MSFDKNYPNRKDQRQPFRKAKAIDRTCRNQSKAENDIKEYKLCEK